MTLAAHQLAKQSLPETPHRRNELLLRVVTHHVMLLQ